MTSASPTAAYGGTTPPGGAYTLTNIQSNIANRDFGYRLQLSSISGTVCAGATGGVCQGGDTPLASVTVTLTSAGPDGILGTADGTTTTTTTNGSGGYTFSNLGPGPYQVSQTNLAGYVSVGDADGGNPDLITVTLAAGQNSVGQDFKDTTSGATATPTPTPTATAVPGTGSVAGTVYNDLNGNGVKDVGEPGIPSVTVKLYTPGPDGILGTGDDVLVATQITDGAGSYSFPNRTPGIYRVRETDPEGFTSSTPNTVSVVINSGSALTVNFGDQQSTPTPTPTATAAPPISSVTGVVFNDQNGTGVQDPGELGIGNVTVQLLNPNTLAVVATTTTAGDGTYLFTQVTPAAYTVQEIDPPGFTSTTPNQVNVTVPPGGSASANFGNRAIGSVSGVVYDDVNGSAVQDPAESGLSGVLISLVSPGPDTLYNTGDDVLVASTTTLPDGSYQFLGVTAGPYQVRETGPAGFVSTTPSNVSVTVPVGGVASANFGDQLRLQPTAVQVTALTASATGADVTIRWTTGSEVDVLGFQLWRGAQPDTGYTRAGAALIPAQALGAGGADYAAVEEGVAVGEWYYRIAIVGLDGQVIGNVGPVAVSVTEAPGRYHLFLPLISR